MGAPDKAIWMPLYVGDYLSDTMHLTTEQHGAYLLLLLAAWKNGGNLPVSDSLLANIVRLPLEQWKSIKPEVIAFFDCAGNVHTQKRLSKELAKATNRLEQCRENGKKGGRPRKEGQEEKPSGSIPVNLNKTGGVTGMKASHNHSNTSLRSVLPPGSLRSPHPPENEKPKTKTKPIGLSELKSLQERPAWLTDELLEKWYAHRRDDLRKPLTERAYQQTLEQLGKAAALGWDPAEMIRDSIANSWQGVVFDRHRVPPRGGAHEASSRSGSRSSAASRAHDAEERIGRGLPE